MGHQKSVYFDRKKISEIEKKCEERLNQILRSANETKEISKATEEELEHQTEQIKHINKESDNIQENLNQTEYHLQGIKYWWKNINTFLGFETLNNNDDKKKKNELTETKVSAKLNDNNNFVKNNETYKNLMEVEPKLKKKTTFDEKYENDLNSLSVVLDELHTRALLMGNTITEQNKMLNDVNKKMECNLDKIKDQQNVMKEIMKK